jgi:hypothetical protein
MKKILLLFSYILFNAIIVFGFDLSGNVFGDADFIKLQEGYLVSISNYRFDKNEYTFFIGLNEKGNEIANIPEDLYSDGRYVETGEWGIASEAGFNFLILNSDNNFTLKKKLGILYHERRMYLYDRDKLFFASNEGLRFDGLMPRVVSLRMSSYLTEGETEYNGNNFYEPYREKLKPWVESVKGQGIGEWIEISTDTYRFPVDFFLISNGYVSFEKSHLYKYNSRIKRIRITCEEHDIDYEVELEDTPNFQEIRLPKKVSDKTTTFRFTILEAYQGEKWDDTCLNLIVPLGDLPK